LAGIKFGDFGQNALFFNLTNFKFGDLVPQPKYYITTMKQSLTASWQLAI